MTASSVTRGGHLPYRESMVYDVLESSG